jgi:hypothetical protein
MMQRFETMDKVALLIATLLIVGGLLGALLPSDFIIAHATTHLRARPATLIEHVTPAHARLYGLAAIVGGAVVAVYVLWATRPE